MRILTERLTLREFVVADAAAVHSYASDPVVTRFLTGGPNTVEDTRTFIAAAVSDAQMQPEGRSAIPSIPCTAAVEFRVAVAGDRGNPWLRQRLQR